MTAPASDTRSHLLLVGGSTRAAAWSAIRAGLHPICADFFADEDLKAVADVLPLKRYPQDILRAASDLPAGIPWMYAGGVENHPRLIAALGDQRPLAGIPAAAVRRVRNPRDAAWKAIASSLAETAFRIPAVCSAQNRPPADGTWMLKPLRGSAGRGIAVWDHAAHDHSTLKDPHFFQQRVAGRPISALLVAKAEGVELIGFSQQWIGETICRARPFQYCGSIGPIAVSDALGAAALRLAKKLADQFGLRGVFGCDFLLDGEVAWLTEVNPRYTASVEVFEFGGARSILAAHLAACGRAPGSPVRWPLGAMSPACVGKAILYARRDFVAPRIPFRPFDGSLPAVADIPQPGSPIPAGAPICTIFGFGADPRECERDLWARVTEWSARLA